MSSGEGRVVVHGRGLVCGFCRGPASRRDAPRPSAGGTARSSGSCERTRRIVQDDPMNQDLVTCLNAWLDEEADLARRCDGDGCGERTAHGQFVLATRPCGTVTLPVPPSVQCGLPPGLPRPGQVLDQTAEMCPPNAGEGGMGQGCTGALLGHTRRTRAAICTSRPMAALIVGGQDRGSPTGTPKRPR